MRYARGKKAYGFSDRSGFRYALNDLVYEYRDGKRTGMRVGRDEVDIDHPQLRLGRTKVDDPQSLFDPRPDTATESLFGFDPVGNPALSMRMSIGYVFVDVHTVGPVVPEPEPTVSTVTYGGEVVTHNGEDVTYTV